MNDPAGRIDLGEPAGTKDLLLGWCSTYSLEFVFHNSLPGTLRRIWYMPGDIVYRLKAWKEWEDARL